MKWKKIKGYDMNQPDKLQGNSICAEVRFFVSQKVSISKPKGIILSFWRREIWLQ